MLKVSRLFTLAIGLCLAIGLALVSLAQAPKGKPGSKPPGDAKEGPPSGGAGEDLVTRMMAFDKNGDGKLTKDEITDRRLLRLFDQADTNKDGVVTKDELTALAAKLKADSGGAGDDRGGPGRGPGGPGRGPGDAGGPGGPGGRGPGGPAGRGPGGRGPGGPPRPGQIMPPFLQDMLKLTDEQKKELDDLQKEVDTKLAKILSDEQKQQLKEMRERGPSGPPGGGPPGFGPGGGGRKGPPGEGDRPRRPEGDAPPPKQP